MGLELDSLKQNDDVTIIYNNTTGDIVEFYAGNSFIKELEKMGVTKKEIFKYFSVDELMEFFDEYNMDLEELEKVIDAYQTAEEIKLEESEDKRYLEK